MLYSAEEWEQKRELIRELYARRLSQKDVLGILADQHNFRPSLCMLKKRISKWGIDRNNKESDILAALQIALPRQAQGKRTEFVIKNRIVTQKEIDRYLQRKGIRDVHAFVANSAQPSSNPFVTPYSPCRSPLIPEPSVSDIEESVDPVDLTPEGAYDEVPLEEPSPIVPPSGGLVVHHNINHIAPPLFATPQDELLQQALTLNGQYYDFFFENLDAFRTREFHDILQSDVPETKELKEFTNGMWRGRDLLIEGQMADAFNCFDKAFATIHKLLANHNRKFLIELYEMMLNFQLDENQDVLRPLLQFLVKMARLNQQSLGQSQNIARIASRLLQLDTHDRFSSVERLLQSILHRFQSSQASDPREALNIRRVLSRSVFRRMKLSEAITYLTNLLQDQQAVNCVESYDKCLILVEIAQCYRFQNRPDDAIAWTRKAWERTIGLDDLHSQTDIMVRCLRTLSWAEAKRNNWLSAHNTAQRAVELSSSILGRDDSLTDLVEAELTQLKEVESETSQLGIPQEPEVNQFGIPLESEVSQFGIPLELEVSQFGIPLELEVSDLGFLPSPY